MVCTRVLLYLFTQFGTIHLIHHEIRDDSIRNTGRYLAPCFFSIRTDLDIVNLLELKLQVRPHFAVVIDKDYLFACFNMLYIRIFPRL